MELWKVQNLTLSLLIVALVGLLVWHVISHQDARAALKEACAYVQRQSVLHAAARDQPEGLLDAIEACGREGLLP